MQTEVAVTFLQSVLHLLVARTSADFGLTLLPPHAGRSRMSALIGCVLFPAIAPGARRPGSVGCVSSPVRRVAPAGELIEKL